MSGMASVLRTCRSYGAGLVFFRPIYQHAAPTALRFMLDRANRIANGPGQPSLPSGCGASCRGGDRRWHPGKRQNGLVFRLARIRLATVAHAVGKAERPWELCSQGRSWRRFLLSSGFADTEAAEADQADSTEQEHPKSRRLRNRDECHTGASQDGSTGGL